MQSNTINRLMQHAGKYRALMVLSWILSAIGGILKMGPYICISFFVRELMIARGDIASFNDEMSRYYRVDYCPSPAPD